MTAAVVIVPTTIALLDREEEGAGALALALDVVPPAVWPPEFNGEPYRRWQRSLLAAHPDEPGCAGYYLIGDGELVGTCGFKGPPDDAGVVEIGYSVIATRRRRGYATAAVDLLVARAFADPRVECVAAETLPDSAASQAVLRRCRFVRAGTRIDADDGPVVRFELRRPR
jgi:RimJ/RimL family protein N-acetyltransferase